MKNADLQTYYDQLRNHYLEPLELGQYLQAYYLREKPGSRMMSVLLIFSPEGIIITGDLNPGRQERKNGIVARGYDIGWFSGKLEPRYLAEKFLTEVWVPEYFREYVRGYIEAEMESQALGSLTAAAQVVIEQADLDAATRSPYGLGAQFDFYEVTLTGPQVDALRAALVEAERRAR